MAQIRFANNVSTQLTKPVAADDSTIEVRSLTHGLVWPNIYATGDYFLIVIDDISSSTWEIMKCTKVQVNDDATVLTVERGLEGTTATTFNAGSVVENRLTAGTLDTFGEGFPAKVEINRGGTGATTAADARTNLDVPSKADLSSEVSTRTSEVARLDQKIIDNIPPAATTSVRGITTLNSAVDSVSETLAATPKAVKTAYDKAVAVDTRLTSEVTTLEAADTATNQKLTSEVSRLEGEIAAHTPPDASLTTKGIVQLNSAVDNASEVLAATPKAVKTAYDKAVAAAAKSASADKLTTARGITLIGPVTGTVDFDGSANASIPTTVVSASTSAKGIVQLSSATNSDSELVAATSKAVKVAYDKAVEASNKAGLPLGHIFAWPFSTAPDGCIILNGSTYDRTLYADFFTYVKSKGWTKTETEWQNIAQANNGFCPWYSEGDGSTNFRTPKFAPYQKLSFVSGDAGKYYEAGLPNITGSLRGSQYGILTDSINSMVSTGALTVVNNTGVTAAGTSASSTYPKGFEFDASRSNSIYGNSTTVQPESHDWIICAVAFGTATNVGSVDVANVMSAVGQVQSDIAQVQSDIVAVQSSIVRASMPNWDTAVQVAMSNGTVYKAPYDGYLVFNGTPDARYGNNLEVILGGHKYNFTSAGTSDVDYEHSAFALLPMLKGTTCKCVGIANMEVTFVKVFGE